MRVIVGEKGGEVVAGATLTQVATLYDKKLASDPMIQLMVAKTGSTQLVFIVNGVVIKASQHNEFILKDGDDIRVVHPYFGG